MTRIGPHPAAGAEDRIAPLDGAQPKEQSAQDGCQNDAGTWRAKPVQRELDALWRGVRGSHRRGPLNLLVSARHIEEDSRKGRCLDLDPQDVGDRKWRARVGSAGHWQRIIHDARVQAPDDHAGDQDCPRNPRLDGLVERERIALRFNGWDGGGRHCSRTEGAQSSGNFGSLAPQQKAVFRVPHAQEQDYGDDGGQPSRGVGQQVEAGLADDKNWTTANTPPATSVAGQTSSAS
jgi:hypothetical protein